MESMELSECALNKFYKRRQEQLAMFFFVQGVIKVLPSVTVPSAIRTFLDYYNIDGDVECLRTEYKRMNDELRELDKTT